jgi:hypothetical protein
MHATETRISSGSMACKSEFISYFSTLATTVVCGVVAFCTNCVAFCSIVFSTRFGLTCRVWEFTSQDPWRLRLYVLQPSQLDPAQIDHLKLNALGLNLSNDVVEIDCGPR